MRPKLRARSSSSELQISVSRAGSRFNLRWAGTIPADQKTPEAITRLLAEFVTLAPAPGAATAPLALQATAVDTNTPATAQLKRGMPMSQVTGLFGQGQQLSGISFP